MAKISTEQRNVEISERVFAAADALVAQGVLKPTADAIKDYIRKNFVGSQGRLGTGTVISDAFRLWKSKQGTGCQVQTEREKQDELVNFFYRKVDTQVDSVTRDLKLELSDANEQIDDLINENTAFHEQNDQLSNEVDLLKSELAALSIQNKQNELLIDSEKARLSAAHDISTSLHATIAELQAREVITQERMVELKKNDADLQLQNSRLSTEILQEKNQRFTAEKMLEVLEDQLDQKAEDMDLANRQIVSLKTLIQNLDMMSARNVVADSVVSDLLMQFDALKTLIEQRSKTPKRGRNSRRSPKGNLSGSVRSGPPANLSH